jgi:hypothetical protein
VLGGLAGPEDRATILLWRRFITWSMMVILGQRKLPFLSPYTYNKSGVVEHGFLLEDHGNYSE